MKLQIGLAWKTSEEPKPNSSSLMETSRCFPGSDLY